MHSHRALQVYLPIILLAFLILYILRHHSPSTTAMPSKPNPQEVASALLAEKDLDVLSLSLLQSLWAGYGQICRVAASPKQASANTLKSGAEGSTPKDSVMSTPKDTHSYILKLISPPSSSRSDEGHIRKILSYQIEQYFYTQLAPQLPASIPVAKCLASINKQKPDGGSTTAMILSDLAQDYPVAGEKRAALTERQALSALDWLSNFHGFWWSRVDGLDNSELVLPPLEQVKRYNAFKKSIWLNGGYTYLATRQSEYQNLIHDSDSEWSEALTQSINTHNQSIAELAATFLAPSTSTATPIESYQTLIHGDVKSENLFTTTTGDRVAFYDFQYVGLGLGVCDLAKFFTCSVPLEMLVLDEDVPDVLAMDKGERELLERYWKNLKEVGGREYEWETFVRHWEIALVDWLRFQASWGFWGNTEWLEARVRSILRDDKWREFLVDAAAGA
jgi:thiamine kinase-like enzyme